jgi:hypothetical protein
MTNRWDDFSKLLAEESSTRRESLRLLGAALAGVVLSPLGLGTAWAGSKTDPCQTFCRCSKKAQQNACLAACRACRNATSRLCGSCGSGYVCTDLANDVLNCGGCGNACQPGPYEKARCIGGKCVYSCAEGAVDCGGTCTFLGSDPDNCGACGNVCDDSAPYCNEGACTSIQCPPGLTLCGGACLDLYNDSGSCGSSCATAVVCGIFEHCEGGICQPNY